MWIEKYLTRQCDEIGCTKPAKWTVFKARNVPVGHYCRRHARRQLTDDS